MMAFHWAGLDAGGPIILAIAILSFIMWVLILNGYWIWWSLYKHIHKGDMRQDIKFFNKLDKGLKGLVVRGWLCQIRQQLNKGQPEIRVMIKLLPLLGLLGTVDGLIDCFHNLGGQNVLQAISSGIAGAMMTTLSGLVCSLSGIYFSYHLKRRHDGLMTIIVQRWG